MGDVLAFGLEIFKHGLSSLEGGFMVAVDLP